MLVGFAGETTGLVDNTTAYLSTQVPFGQAKSVAYVAFAAASIFDLLEGRRFQMAEAQLGLLLCAIEQAALREWRWNHAWLLTHQPEPPWHRIRHTLDRSSIQTMSRLASPVWMAATIAYSRDAAVLAEADRSTRRTEQEEERAAQPKGKGQQQQKATPP